MDRKRQTEQDKKTLRQVTKQERHNNRPGRKEEERCDRQNQVGKHAKQRRWSEDGKKGWRDI